MGARATLPGPNFVFRMRFSQDLATVQSHVGLPYDYVTFVQLVIYCTWVFVDCFLLIKGIQVGFPFNYA
jgi:hypothetical protein